MASTLNRLLIPFARASSASLRRSSVYSASRDLTSGRLCGRCGVVHVVAWNKASLTLGRNFVTSQRRSSKAKEAPTAFGSESAEDAPKSLTEADVGVVDVFDAPSKKTPLKPSRDLEALTKFDVIRVDDAGTDLAETSPRKFEVAETTGLPPVMLPDKDRSGRRRPESKGSSIINPKATRKPLLLGDRADPPKLDFSFRSQIFDEIAELEGGKTKKSFVKAIDTFCKIDPVYRRGHVELIYKATNLLKEYGLQTDLDGYKAILNLFPEGPFRPKNKIQGAFDHYPRQNDCAVDLMTFMQLHKVIPDKEFGDKLKAIFSRDSRAHRKFRRMTYWLPKFKYASPFPYVPLETEALDPRDLAKLALERICVDLENEIDFHEVPDKFPSPDQLEDRWIASAMSPKQRELIAQLPMDEAIYVKGPFVLFIRGSRVDHYVLWAKPKPLSEQEEMLPEEYKRLAKDIDELLDTDVTRQAYRGANRKNPLAHRPSCHEQMDGTILAISVLEEYSEDLLMAWVKFLESSNPHLSDVPVIFSLSSVPPTDLVTVDEQDDQLAYEPV